MSDTHTPRHRDSVRPVDSYSAAVDPYRAPRHLRAIPASWCVTRAAWRIGGAA